MIFKPKIDFCQFFVYRYIFIMFKILRLHLHYDIIVTSCADGWYLFGYQWKEEIHIHVLLIGSKHKGVGWSLEKIQRGLHHPPPSENVLQKMALEEEG